MIPGPTPTRTSLHFDYAAGGQIAQKKWTVTDATAYNYGAANVFDGSETYVASFTYDTQGRLDTLTYPHRVQGCESPCPAQFEPLTVRYGYDPYTGKDATITDVANTSAPLWKVNARSERGDPIGESMWIAGTKLASMSVNRTFAPADGSMILSNLFGRDASLKFFVSPQIQYSYQADGLPATLSGPTSAKQSFGNDNLGRLTSWQADVNVASPVVTYTYDGAGNLASRVWSGETVTYGVNCCSDQFSRYVTTKRGSAAAQSDNYGMDANLRIVRTPAASSIAYTADDNVATVKLAATGRIDTLVRDGTGRRVLTLLGSPQHGDPEVTGSLVTLDDLYDLRREPRPSVSVYEHRYHLRADGRRVGDVIESANVRTASLFLEDNVHSVVAEVSSEATSTISAPRDPYGNAFTSSVTPFLGADPGVADPVAAEGNNRLGFAGHPRDKGWGFVDMLARPYSPRLGRFMVADAVIGNVLDRRDHNPFAYVRNSPTSSWDPSGNECIGAECGGGGGNGGIGWVPGQPNPHPMCEEVWCSHDPAPPPPPPAPPPVSGPPAPREPTPSPLPIGAVSRANVSVSASGQADGSGAAEGSWTQGGNIWGGPNAGYVPSDRVLATEVTLVGRSIGNSDGLPLKAEGHAALIFNVGTPYVPDHWLVQGGPTPTNGLAGWAVHVPSTGWFTEFAQARGANWSNPNAIVTLPVTVMGTFVTPMSLGGRDLVGMANALNLSLVGQTYQYETGPNSNTYVQMFMGMVGLPSQFTPGGLLLRGWAVGR